MTEESLQRLARRTALIQEETGATTRDAASLAACIATGGDNEYARQFAGAVAALASKGHTADQLPGRLEIRSKSNEGFERDHSPDRWDLTADLDRQIEP
jgi:hypothetical protein